MDTLVIDNPSSVINEWIEPTKYWGLWNYRLRAWSVASNDLIEWWLVVFPSKESAHEYLAWERKHLSKIEVDPELREADAPKDDTLPNFLNACRNNCDPPLAGVAIQKSPYDVEFVKAI